MSSNLGAIGRLPVEVLSLIALQQLDGKGIYSLRLVCKAFKALVTPLAFKTLPFVRNYSDNNHGNQLVTQIQALATGASPYSQWAHTLLIDHGGLYPYLKRSPSYETNKKKALDGRAQFLVPAIESLRNLKRASFKMDTSDPYEEVLHVLAQLPKLDDLSLTLGWSFDRPPAALDEFSHLRILDLIYWRLFPSNLDAIESLLSRCSPNLESLALLPAAWPSSRSQWLEQQLKGELRNIPLRRVTADTTFPRLRKLVVNAYGIHLAGFSPTTFRVLTHLEIRSCGEGSVASSFWDSLTGAGVRLEALHIFPLAPAACDYLASYAGLRTLRLCHAPSEFAPSLSTESVEEMAHRLFYVILPAHQRTLQHLAFEGIKFEAFGLDQGRIEKVLNCEQLEVLWALYDHPSGRPYDTAHPDLIRLLSQIVTNLACLQQLTMQPALRSYNRPLPPGSITIPIEPRRALLAVFWGRAPTAPEACDEDRLLGKRPEG
ncbi:hypothetical protein NMY22_g6325 [Coprinellus aureogranulatus]|nr:hypothetical protein NMY22_g6325 [Coprinellus aureogranulatus]